MNTDYLVVVILVMGISMSVWGYSMLIELRREIYLFRGDTNPAMEAILVGVFLTLMGIIIFISGVYKE